MQSSECKQLDLSTYIMIFMNIKVISLIFCPNPVASVGGAVVLCVIILYITTTRLIAAISLCAIIADTGRRLCV